MNKSAAYVDGQQSALAFYKIAEGGHLGKVLPLLAALGIPLAAGTVAALTARSGERVRDGLLTGGGSAAGGLPGAALGVGGGYLLGEHLAKGIPNQGFGGNMARGLAVLSATTLGGGLGYGAGQLGGAAAGHVLSNHLSDRE